MAAKVHPTFFYFSFITKHFPVVSKCYEYHSGITSYRKCFPLSVHSYPWPCWILMYDGGPKIMYWKTKRSKLSNIWTGGCRILLHFSLMENFKNIKGAGSSNVNQFLSKWWFCDIFDGPYHRDFPPLFSKWRCYIEYGLLNCVEIQMQNSYVVRLHRYWWILRINFIVDSPHPPKSVQNTVATHGQQFR